MTSLDSLQNNTIQNDIYLKIVDDKGDLDIMEFAKTIEERHGIKWTSK